MVECNSPSPEPLTPQARPGGAPANPLLNTISGLDAWVAYDAATQVSQLARLYHAYDPEQTSEDYHVSPPLDQLNLLFETALPFFESAGFEEIGWKEIQKASQSSTPHGVNLFVDPSCYQAMLVLRRGQEHISREHRPWWGFWRKQEYDFEVYTRIILMLKPDPAKFFDKDLDTDSVFLRLFRDVPVKDLEMILPGGKVKITLLDRALIYYPVFAGLGLLFYQILPHLMANAFFAVGVYALFKWTVAMALGGWSWRSYSAYRGKMERYGMKLSKHLYMQTLDSNLGVFTRLGADIATSQRAVLGEWIQSCGVDKSPDRLSQIAKDQILAAPKTSQLRQSALLSRWLANSSHVNPPEPQRAP